MPYSLFQLLLERSSNYLTTWPVLTNSAVLLWTLDCFINVRTRSRTVNKVRQKPLKPIDELPGLDAFGAWWSWLDGILRILVKTWMKSSCCRQLVSRRRVDKLYRLLTPWWEGCGVLILNHGLLTLDRLIAHSRLRDNGRGWKQLGDVRVVVSLLVWHLVVKTAADVHSIFSCEEALPEKVRRRWVQRYALCGCLRQQQQRLERFSRNEDKLFVPVLRRFVFRQGVHWRFFLFLGVTERSTSVTWAYFWSSRSNEWQLLLCFLHRFAIYLYSIYKKIQEIRQLMLNVVSR